MGIGLPLGLKRRLAPALRLVSIPVVRAIVTLDRESVVVPSRGVRECTVCGYRGPFRSFAGLVPRFDAICPGCGGLERHRLLFLAMERTGLLPEGIDLLHIAPEPAISERLRARCRRYVTADLEMPGVDVTADIADLPFADGEFDAVLCNQVIEHVPDDAAALRELGRVLRPGGVAVVTTPVIEGMDATYEAPEARSVAERRLHFGQGDHLRLYGRDIRERIAAAGFALEEVGSTGADCARHALQWGERLFLCRRTEG